MRTAGILAARAGEPSSQLGAGLPIAGCCVGGPWTEGGGL